MLCCLENIGYVKAVVEDQCLTVLSRARRDYWEKLRPASGRPFCPSMSTPDGWGVTKGHADLMQQKEATSEEQLKALFEKASKAH